MKQFPNKTYDVQLNYLKAEEVLPIFYDTLALQFIQRLDDIVFAVSKMEVLGIRMQRATMTPYFHTPFQREKGNLGLKWKTRTLLKTLYFINLAVFITCMVVVTGRQISGYYQCQRITALWGDKIWRKAIVMWPQDSLQYPPGLVERMVLAYDYFDGVYVKDGSRTVNGRPVYIEMKKSDRTSFDSVAPKMNPYHVDGSQEYAIDPVKPATIKYCEGRWILSHDYILKSIDETVSMGICTHVYTLVIALYLYSNSFVRSKRFSMKVKIVTGLQDLQKQKAMTY